MTYDHIQHTENEFELREVSIFEVLKLVDKLSKRKASGSDNIPIRLGTLTYILNLVICSGIIPADWKSFMVTPIHKEDCKMDPNNYRPISVLPVIAKMFEIAIFNQTYDF